MILFRFMEEVSRFRSRCRKYLFALKTRDTEGEDLSNDRKIVGVHVRWAGEKKKKKKKSGRRTRNTKYPFSIRLTTLESDFD